MLCHELIAKGFPAEEFMKSLLEGDKSLGTDPHSVNRDGINEILGVDLLDRTLSKTVFYAAVFGASATKMAKTIGCDEATAVKVMSALYALVPGLDGIKDVLISEIKQKGYVAAIDGRPLYIRSPHMALVSLMQGDEAAAMEMSMAWADAEIRKAGLDAHQLIYYHDELDYEAKDEQAHECGEILEASITWPGTYLGLNIPLIGESQYGQTWAEVH
jgi:DNA polymerase-1